MKADPTVKRETIYILVWIAALSVVMHAVYLLIGKWDLGVLCGNLMGAAAAAGSFYLMGLTVQKCLGLPKEKVAARVRASQYGRLLMQLGIVLLAVLVLHADVIAALATLLFPRIAVTFRPRFKLPGDEISGPVTPQEDQDVSGEES